MSIGDIMSEQEGCTREQGWIDTNKDGKHDWVGVEQNSRKLNE